MKNIDSWKSSKFIIKNNKLEPSENVSKTSYRMASFIALFYTEQLNKHCHGTLLDLGCGSVPMFEFYKNKVQDITCADWENCAHETSHIDVYCDLNTKLPFDDNSFDTIIFSDVLEHLSNPKGTLSEIHRILKKNGTLIMNFPFMYGLHEEPFDYCRYTKYRIRTWLDELQFTIIVEEEYGGLVELVEHSILRLLNTKKGGKYLSSFIAALFKRLYKSKPNKNSKHPYMYGYVIQK